ncbi:MAG TPA: hypothetical protein DEF18_06985 [Muricauda sp.]|nr:hypothetical protein [uncultured Allomuricauda sp.]MBC72998.1 hypothetical protein [Allomuricauda sp.]HBU77831.1 hypothetical protein [Allomuricauda sp.]|tara:strand:+ start:31719 stop:32141 length:423 start_codon:yes stop_codon:yes gene_type:complete
MKIRNGSYKLSDKRFWEKIKKDFGEGGGAYELYCMLPKTEIVPVQRMLKTDESGTLYIGRATSFLDRVIALKKSISPDHTSSNHECGVRYKDSKTLQEKFPYEYLYIELLGTDKGMELEREKLKSYVREFGELPPLNRVS